MFARKAPATPRVDDLFARVGAFLHAQGLSSDPANYAFAHQLLTRTDPAARAAIADLEADGIRLSREQIAAMGGNVVAGPGLDRMGRDADACEPPTAAETAADRLVEQTRLQVEAVAGMMRSMHDETRGFGRDLAESAAAFGRPGAAAAPDRIVRLTQAMIARVTSAETRLAAAAAEADTLRAELAEAQATARRDPLTGLPNRLAFAEAFAVPGGESDGGPEVGRCVAIIDIDRFKAINDGFGHPVGDRVLSAVARILADTCDGHLVTRCGGEEFALLLDGDLAGATALLDAARVEVGRRRFRVRDSDAAIGHVTFSAGVVAVAPGEDAEAALARADALLYRAKEAGRDQVIGG